MAQDIASILGGIPLITTQITMCDTGLDAHANVVFDLHANAYKKASQAKKYFCVEAPPSGIPVTSQEQSLQPRSKNSTAADRKEKKDKKKKVPSLYSVVVAHDCIHRGRSPVTRASQRSRSSQRREMVTTSRTKVTAPALLTWTPRVVVCSDGDTEDSAPTATTFNPYGNLEVEQDEGRSLLLDTALQPACR